MKSKNISSTKQREELPPTQRSKGYSIIEGMIRQSLDNPIDSSEILTCPYGKLYKDSDQCQQPIPKDKKRGGV